MRFARYDKSQVKGYEGNSRYVVSPEEDARARIGLFASGGFEFLDILPITHSLTEGSHSHRDSAEAVLVGNIALLGQLSTNEPRPRAGDSATRAKASRRRWRSTRRR